MAKYEYLVCSGCFKSVPRKEMAFKRACSEECRSKIISKKKCKPFCDPNGFEEHDVTFRNGTNHIKRVCGRCRRGRYISRNPEKVPEKLILIQRAMARKHGDSFYTSMPWIRLRYQALEIYGKRCMACGSSDGKMHVDHIKPRRMFPELELEFNNLQILCEDCNIGKGSWDQTDWRPKIEPNQQSERR